MTNIELSIYQKEIQSILEKKIDTNLNKQINEGKLIILDWKWTIEFKDYELFNKFADVFNKEKSKNKSDKKDFFCDLSEQYSNWNISYF